MCMKESKNISFHSYTTLFISILPASLSRYYKNGSIIIIFQGMHVSPAKYSNV